MRTLKPLLALAILALAAFLLGDARAFQIFQPNAVGDYIKNSPPEAQPPFVHWDLRQYDSCTLPWSIRYPAGVFPPLDADLNGTINDAADKAAIQTALTNGLNAWQGVAPSIVNFNMLGAAPAAIRGIARDKYNLFSFESSVAQDDQQCVAVGAGAGGAHQPVVAPGPDLVLTTQAQGDDVVVPCIVSGADGNSDTTALGDDVSIVASGGAVPGGCNVVVTAGPNGKLDTAPNNAPAGPADDVASACVVAGPNATSNTPRNNQGTAGVGLTGLFFNTSSGVIYETDIEFGAQWWAASLANGAPQPAVIVAGGDGDADTVAAGDDVQNFAVGTVGLNQNAIVIGPGPNGVLNTGAAAGDLVAQTFGLQMIATHEVGHALGIAHPVDGRNSDDVQVVAVGGAVAPGGNVVTAGVDGNSATMPLGDDLVSGTSIVDGGNGIAETPANNAQLSNSILAGATNNIMNPFFTTANPTNHVLSVDDQMACNWMYTPDLGDAPDACPWPPGAFNKYQSKVHTTTIIDTLNAQNVFDPAKGPDQLFGYLGPAAPSGRQYNGMRYEWLGGDMDDSALECEARLQDIDAFDDGVVYPDPLIRGQVNTVTVTITHTNKAGRYVLPDALRHLYFNGYFDWNQTCLFTPAMREIWWDGIPGTTVANSPNWIGAAHSFATHPTPSTTVLTFDVFVPLNAAPEFYCRFRLDYGENEARVRNVNGDLNPAEHVAQFGEVEDKICHTVEVDQWASTLATVDIRVPPDSPTPHVVTLTGPSKVYVDLGGIADTDGNGKEQVHTDMVQMDLTGTDPNFGTVIVHRRDPALHPFHTSTGQIEEDNNLTNGTLDISPFVTIPAGLTADSFFDIWPEVQIPSLALTLHTHSAKRMKGRLTHKPPGPGDTYWNPDYVPLYNDAEVMIAMIGPAYHTPNPPPVPHEIDLFSASTAQVDVRMPAGSPVPHIVQLTGPTTVDVNLPGIADTDGDLKEQVTTQMIGLELTGADGTLGSITVRTRPPGVHPFQKTVGEIEEDTSINSGTLDLPPFTNSPPGLTASSYFDVFLQAELPMFGLKLHNHVPKRMSGTIRHKPPADGDTYQSPLFIDLFDDSENLVAQLGPGQHVPNPTNDTGACCRPSGCSVITLSHCAALGGDYLGGGTTCASCSTGPCTGQPNGTPCDDTNACTSGDNCQGGLCVGSPFNPMLAGTIFVSKQNVSNPEPDFNARIDYPPTQIVDIIRGSTLQLRATQNFAPSVQNCLANNFNGPPPFPENGTVPPNDAAYFLLRPVGPAGCGQAGSYSTGSPKERPGRDPQIQASPAACP